MMNEEKGKVDCMQRSSHVVQHTEAAYIINSVISLYRRCGIFEMGTFVWKNQHMFMCVCNAY